MNVQCHVATIRRQRGISASELARRAGVQRQTIYSIESGTYLPNTAVALVLARELEVAVEDLFTLPQALCGPQPTMSVRLLGRAPGLARTPVRVARVGGQHLALPLDPSPCFLADADGVLAAPARAASMAPVNLTGDLGERVEPLLVAGCDPALGLLAAETAATPVYPVSASSQSALEWLRQGWVHVAGCHLQDARTGEYNLPALRKFLPGEELVVVTFAEWEEGFVLAAGNPLGVREAADLANPRVRLVNREPGSGSRALLDALLRQAGLHLRHVSGYRNVARSHLAAARTVAEGHADCCVATSSAAQAFHLDFVAVRKERFDLVLRRENVHLPGVRALLDALHRHSLRRKLETLAGYDTRNTGRKVLG